MSIAALFKRPSPREPAPIGPAHAQHDRLHAERQQQVQEFDTLSERIASIHAEVVAHDQDRSTLSALEKALHDSLVAIEMGRTVNVPTADTRDQIETLRTRIDAPRNLVLAGIRSELEAQRLALRDRQIDLDKRIKANLWEVLRERLETEAPTVLADRTRFEASRRRAYVIASAMDSVVDQLHLGTHTDARSYLDLIIPMPRLAPLTDIPADNVAEGQANARHHAQREADVQALHREADDLLRHLLLGEALP